jgi:hypothetical protein
MLFAEIDHGAWISKFRIFLRLVRWILGNPFIAITMIRHDVTAGLFAPVELLVTEAEDGSGCELIHIRPSSQIIVEERNRPLMNAAVALDEKLATVVRYASTPTPEVSL